LIFVRAMLESPGGRHGGSHGIRAHTTRRKENCQKIGGLSPENSISEMWGTLDACMAGRALPVKVLGNRFAHTLNLIKPPDGAEPACCSQEELGK
jgi:hypothetical protein